MTFLLFVLGNIARRVEEWADSERERREGLPVTTVLAWCRRMAGPRWKVTR